MSKVTLRSKQGTKGRSSYFLDHYPPLINPDNGKPQRKEYLKIFTFDNPKTDADRLHNRETKKLLEHIRASRQIDVQNQEFGFLSDEQKNGSFIDFYRSFAVKKSGSNSDNWYMSLRYLISFASHNLRYSDLTEWFCEDYKDYLLSGPSINQRGKKIIHNTAMAYFAKFRSVLKKAYQRKMIKDNLYEFVPPIKEQETNREFLTIEEFQKLAETEAPSDLFKRAALFSGLTGLRFSDVTTLLWNQAWGTEENYYLQFRQEKTNGAEVLPIADQAYELLGERGEPRQKVFAGLTYSQVRWYLSKWLAKAGIEKNITFHSFRHTYATLQLEAGTDIYTVSKMLGHKHVKTTQRYTKVVDKTKKAATKKITLKL
ncbi:site-specific integrase [Mucilaginibacter sp.]|uniref:tyrosine-type recombinase/integrase n=1 Tax=Mucilaginibacter sp. TaxID=1882438 RepID=UPI003266B4F6